jgi:hypothetical protein
VNKYSYFSEKEALESELLADLRANTEKYLNLYLDQGFEGLAAKFSFNQDWQKRLVFDFLVFEKKAVLTLIRQNSTFFLSIISEGNGEMIAEMLGITGRKYRKIWHQALEELNAQFIQKELDDKLFNFACSVFFRSEKHKGIFSNEQSARE